MEVAIKVDEPTVPPRGSHLPAVQAAVPGYTIPDSTSKELLVQDGDVQGLHGLDTAANAQAYLLSELFTKDVVEGLSSLLKAEPEIVSSSG